MTVGNSIFYSNGNSDDDGGIQNGFSTVTVSNSAFSGHSAHIGGDIFGDHGAVTLKHMIGATARQMRTASAPSPMAVGT